MAMRTTATCGSVRDVEDKDNEWYDAVGQK
jgi:hypothetical protein